MRFDLATRSFVEREFGPDRLAVIGDDRTLTWRELAAKAEIWCAAAQASGFAPDVPVIVRGHKEAAFFVAMVGSLMLGTPFVPIDTIYPDARLDTIASTLGAQTYYDARRDAFRELPVRGTVPGTTAAHRMLEERDLAYILFTSGTTGEPKGVQIGRESVAALTDWMAADFGLGTAPVFMNQAPFSFDLSMYEVFGTLASGGTIVQMARTACAPGPAFIERLATARVDTWVSTPSFAQQHLLNPRFAQAALSDLSTFLFCGEVLPVSLAQRLRERFPSTRILNTYGPTEATVATTWIEVDEALLAAHPERLPIGSPRRGSRVWIDNGELCIAGPHVMRGYLNRADLNATRMFEHAGMRAFHSGDLGSTDTEGLLYCHGRIDEQVKLGGYRIELGEIDAALGMLSGGPRAAAVPLRRPDGSVARIVAVVERRESGEKRTVAPIPVDWKDQLAQKLPTYMIPSELVVCESLPVTINFKVDRARLAEDYREGRFAPLIERAGC